MGLSSDDQKPPFSNEVDNLTFGEKEINYDYIKDIHNEPEESHSASEYLVIYIIRIHKYINVHVQCNLDYPNLDFSVYGYG